VYFLPPRSRIGGLFLRSARQRIGRFRFITPACGHATSPVHDLFHRAMERAVEQSGSVDVLHGAASRRLLEIGGGMGALLRYPSPVPQVVAAGAEQAQKH
jgi:hypothetical protein